MGAPHSKYLGERYHGGYHGGYHGEGVHRTVLLEWKQEGGGGALAIMQLLNWKKNSPTNCYHQILILLSIVLQTNFPGRAGIVILDCFSDLKQLPPFLHCQIRWDTSTFPKVCQIPISARVLKLLTRRCSRQLAKCCPNHWFTPVISSYDLGKPIQGSRTSGS